MKNQGILWILKTQRRIQRFRKSLTKSTTLKIKPVNEDFSIVIEKIGVNAPIVPDVPITDERFIKSLGDRCGACNIF